MVSSMSSSPEGSGTDGKSPLLQWEVVPLAQSGLLQMKDVDLPAPINLSVCLSSPAINPFRPHTPDTLGYKEKTWPTFFCIWILIFFKLSSYVSNKYVKTRSNSL